MGELIDAGLAKLGLPGWKRKCRCEDRARHRGGNCHNNVQVPRDFDVQEAIGRAGPVYCRLCSKHHLVNG
jgi:hypothetical protein